jgi:hypothetical protein
MIIGITHSNPDDVRYLLEGKFGKISVLTPTHVDYNASTPVILALSLKALRKRVILPQKRLIVLLDTRHACSRVTQYIHPRLTRTLVKTLKPTTTQLLVKPQPPMYKRILDKLKPSPVQHIFNKLYKIRPAARPIYLETILDWLETAKAPKITLTKTHDRIDRLSVLAQAALDKWRKRTRLRLKNAVGGDYFDDLILDDGLWLELVRLKLSLDRLHGNLTVGNIETVCSELGATPFDINFLLAQRTKREKRG